MPSSPSQPGFTLGRTLTKRLVRSFTVHAGAKDSTPVRPPSSIRDKISLPLELSQHSFGNGTSFSTTSSSRPTSALGTPDSSIPSTPPLSPGGSTINDSDYFSTPTSIQTSTRRLSSISVTSSCYSIDQELSDAVSRTDETEGAEREAWWRRPTPDEYLKAVEKDVWW